MQVSLRRFSLALAEPLATADGRLDRREGVLVRLSDGEVAGLGEATPLAGWTESLEGCVEALEAARETVAAGDLGSALAGLADASAARHGLSLARDDLAARRDGLPLYRRLGAADRVGSVPVNATVGDGEVAETVSAARAARDAGFPALKVKVGVRPVEADAARVAAVRDAIGPDVTLRADANGAWTPEEARRAFDEFADSAVEYVEQPLAPDDLAGHADLRGGPVSVAVDETVASAGPGRVIDAGAADVLVLKPMALGGVDRAREAATRTTEAGLSAVVTTTVDAAVARLGAVHLAASLPDPEPAGLATGRFLAEDVAPDPAPVRDGRAQVPQRDGHGVRVEGWSP